jgi:hypothetical protein
MSTTRVRRPCEVFEVTAEAEITHDDLRDAGWHHEDDCPAKGGRMPVSTVKALESLHRQAHPQQTTDLLMCREEPCRSLTVEQVIGRPVAA